MGNHVEIISTLDIADERISLELHKRDSKYILFVKGTNRRAVFRFLSIKDFKEFLNDIIKAVEVSEL